MGRGCKDLHPQDNEDGSEAQHKKVAYREAEPHALEKPKASALQTLTSHGAGTQAWH